MRKSCEDRKRSHPDATEAEKILAECQAAADRMDWDWFKAKFGTSLAKPIKGPSHPRANYSL